jgi:hypothetical protein
MKVYVKISVYLILILLTSDLSAADNNCNIRKTFPVKRGAALRLTNKYGDVNIITGKDDSLSVCATISIAQNDDALAQKNIKLITVRIEKIHDTVYISTIYDKKFFSEAYRQDRKSFSVDYIIKMPSYMDIGITNEFGNVLVDELSGTLNVRLSQGNMSAKKLTKGNIKPINSISIDHGKAIIDELNWMTLSVINCPLVSIGKAQALLITSAISKITIGDISSLVSNSKSDSYSINSVNNIVSESIYSSYSIEKLNGQIRSKSTYGSLNISDINNEFSNIDIVSDQSRITLKAGQDVSFRADIALKGTFVEFPEEKFPGIIKSDSDKTTYILGKTGIDKETRSVIRIRATSGRIKVQ